MRKTAIFVLICTVASTLPAFSMTLDEMRNRFSAAVSTSEGEIDKQLKSLKRNYLEALFRYEAEVKRDGDLDGLKIVRDEIQRVDSSETYTPSMKTGLPRLEYLASVMGMEMDKIYVEEAQKISTLIENITSYSEKQVVELTRQGDLQGALAMREWSNGLRSQPKVADLLRKGKQSTARASNNENLPRLLRGKPATVIRDKREKFQGTPMVYAVGSQPDGKEKRIREERTTAAASGMTTFQAKLGLIEEKENLASYRSWGYRSDHDSFLYVARLEIGLLPNQSLGNTLVVFDLFKRGSGSRRSVIRTEGVLLPEMRSGDRWVIDSGMYTYEVRESDSSWGYDSKSTTADEFYGYTVSIFDNEGTLIYQRCTERALAEIARTNVPESFDPPQEHDDD